MKCPECLSEIGRVTKGFFTCSECNSRLCLKRNKQGYKVRPVILWKTPREKVIPAKYQPLSIGNGEISITCLGCGSQVGLLNCRWAVRVLGWQRVIKEDTLYRFIDQKIVSVPTHSTYSFPTQQKGWVCQKCIGRGYGVWTMKDETRPERVRASRYFPASEKAIENDLKGR